VCTGWPIRPLGPEHDRYRVGGKEIEKERVLTLDELKAFFAMLDSEDADVTDTIRLALKCVLLTAQRPGDVTGMMLSELHDLDGPAPHWIIPAARTKNKLAEHTVPLSPAAVRLIGEALNASKDEGLMPAKKKRAARTIRRFSLAGSKASRPSLVIR
jgi:integrase